MKYFILAFLAALSAPAAQAATLECHDLYSNLKIQLTNVDSKVHYSITIPNFTPDTPGSDPTSGPIVLTGTIANESANWFAHPEASPFLFDAHTETAPVTYTAADGISHTSSGILNLSINEITIKGTGGITSSRGGSLHVLAGSGHVARFDLMFGPLEGGSNTNGCSYSW
ncbi:MAG: hypothetical protein ACXVCS_14085 [Bdellovibrionota bacterium]